ncbi:MAG: histidinol-phosphatase HisJ family protein [Ruminococcaceae bacterium]|nr:histidinol-phosphatase HisJ family protein [Oscillospiraceae bacterium]
MKLTNFHTHTTFCDGAHTPEEIVLHAIELDFDAIGFSGHGHIYFDKPGSMTPEMTEEYIKTVSALKEKYSGKIKIFCGVEQDYYCAPLTHKFDYVIGSVHYVKKDGGYLVVDASADILEHGVNTLYGGDIYSACEDYFANVADVVNKTDCDIIGHFDLITKYNEKRPLIDINHPRYVKAATAAIENLIPTGRVFEINTGAIARGLRTTPYPCDWMLREIAKRGGKVILSSDSHNKNTINCAFDEARELALSCGFEKIEEYICK